MGPRAHARRRRTARGFSLVELIAAMTISSIVLSVAISGVVLSNQQMISLQRRAELDRETKLLVEYLLADVQSAGSGSYRPWSMIMVENNVDGGSDRLHLAEVDDDLGECGIVERPGTGAVFAMDESGGCCLETPSLAAWEGRRLMAVTGNGAVVKMLKSNNAVSGSCHINFPAADFDATADHALDKLPGSMDNFAGGSLALVKIRTLRVDPATHQLILEEDIDSDWTVETHVIAEDVYDLQVALGYDVDKDGTVYSNGSNSDEYLFNAAGDALGAGGLSEALVSDLRMIQIGLVVGASVAGANPSVKVLDGPVHSEAGVLFRPAQGRVHFRNLSLYDQ